MRVAFWHTTDVFLAATDVATILTDNVFLFYKNGQELSKNRDVGLLQIVLGCRTRCRLSRAGVERLIWSDGELISEHLLFYFIFYCKLHILLSQTVHCHVALTRNANVSSSPFTTF